MTLRHLHTTLTRLLEAGTPDDTSVVVALSEGGLGGTPVSPVKDAYRGIDWNHGQLLLTTETPVVHKPKTKRQRRDEWEKERAALWDRTTRQLGLIGASVRLLSTIRSKAQLSEPVLLMIASYERAVKKTVKGKTVE